MSEAGKEQEVVENDSKTQEEAKTSAETKKTEQHMIPKSRLDEVLAEKRKLEKEVSAQAKAREEAQQSQLEEQGKYKELYEKSQTEAAEAAASLAGYQAETLKRDVATKAGHPALWNRITGETQEDLEADMATLIESLPKAQAPDISGGTGSGKRSTETDDKVLTEQAKASLAARLGVRPSDLPDTLEFELTKSIF